MKPQILYAALMGAGLVWLGAGCGEKTDTASQLDRATAVMEQSAPAPAPVAAPEQQQIAAPVAAPAPAPATEMKQAITSFKTGNLADAVNRLQKLRNTPVMAPEQRIAVNDAIAAVMNEITTMAQQGDPKAIQALERYRQLQNNR